MSYSDSDLVNVGVLNSMLESYTNRTNPVDQTAGNTITIDTCCTGVSFGSLVELMVPLPFVATNSNFTASVSFVSITNVGDEQFRAIAKVEYVIPLPESPITEGDLANDGEVVDKSQETDPFPTDVTGETYDPETYGDYEPTDLEDYDFDWGGTGSGAYTTDLTEEELALLPQAISITTQPTDLEYTSGEPIDFSGIEVTLQLDGSTYTSDAYPDGIVPYGELVFPTTTAVRGDGDYSGMATSDLKSTYWEQPIPFYSSISTSKGYYFTAINGAVLVIFAATNDSFLAVIGASSSAGYLVEANYQGSTGIVTNASKYSYTHNDQTVYYTDILFISGPIGTCSFNVPAHQWNADHDKLAWTVIYGDTTLVSDVSIPVQWMRSDGTMLEDTYTVTVNSNRYADEPEDDGTSDGWTDMEDGFSGSGGGSF